MAQLRTALVLLDVHQGVFGYLPPDLAQSVKTAMLSALDTARKRQMPVIFVVPNHRPGYPELDPRFPAIREQGLFCSPQAADGLPPEFARRENEPVVTKFVYSPFYATDLELLLRRAGCEAVVLAGISTSGVVLSALRGAFDRGFDVTILSDACGDPDPQVHAMLTSKLFPAQARVLEAGQWAGST